MWYSNLWYLSENIRKLTKYKPMADVIDYYSKWFWTFPVSDKESEPILQCIKYFISAIGKPKN